MKPLLIFFLLLSTGVNGWAQDITLKVWPEGPPTHNGMDEPEEEQNAIVKNISEAELSVYLPEAETNTGTAVVICPGGGYWVEAMDYEGTDMARWLAGKGVAGIVLKYRLPYGHHKIPSADARQALRMVRMNAGAWGIDPGKIGIAGSSAGGHLASTVGTRFDYGDKNAPTPAGRMSSRPDFMLLLYPVITFRESYGHMGSRRNLIGEGNDWQLVKTYSNELHVSSGTPPAFLVLADDDTGVAPRNSVEFYLALKAHNVPAEMHIFREGGHGFGMKKTGLPVDRWPELFHDWLKAIKMIG